LQNDFEHVPLLNQHSSILEHYTYTKNIFEIRKENSPQNIQFRHDIAGLHDHFNRGQLFIKAIFQLIKGNKKTFKMEKDWLEKSLDRKPAPIEAIM